CQQSSSFPYSF
nr:immunoglobulin light chain junction region [Macaca mulatta]